MVTLNNSLMLIIRTLILEMMRTDKTNIKMPDTNTQLMTSDTEQMTSTITISRIVTDTITTKMVAKDKMMVRFVADVVSSNCTMEIFTSNRISKSIAAKLSMVMFLAKLTLITVVNLVKDQLQNLILTKDVDLNGVK